jgi:hypothetical protein
MEHPMMHNYRIYDTMKRSILDTSSFDDVTLCGRLLEVEKQRKQNFNLDFNVFLKKRDVDAELIQDRRISFLRRVRASKQSVSVLDSILVRSHQSP